MCPIVQERAASRLSMPYYRLFRDRWLAVWRSKDVSVELSKATSMSRKDVDQRVREGKEAKDKEKNQA